jgi:hypothetical protein
MTWTRSKKTSKNTSKIYNGYSRVCTSVFCLRARAGSRGGKGKSEGIRTFREKGKVLSKWQIFLKTYFQE